MILYLVVMGCGLAIGSYINIFLWINLIKIIVICCCIMIIVNTIQHMVRKQNKMHPIRPIFIIVNHLI